MDKISEYSYDEINPHKELKLYQACMVDDLEGFTIELDGDHQTAKIIFK
jgi:hypothetical protein